MTNSKDTQKPPQEPNEIVCAFCGRHSDDVAAMISGPNGIYICDECVAICADAMMQDLGFGMHSYHDSDDASFYGRHVLDSRDYQDVGPDSGEPDSRPDDILRDLPTPHKLYAELSEHVVGQEKAKKAKTVNREVLVDLFELAQEDAVAMVDMVLELVLAVVVAMVVKVDLEDIMFMEKVKY